MLVIILSPTINTIVLGIALTSWPNVARLARGEARRLRGSDFIQAALVLGFSPFFSRLVEAALREIDQGRIEAARSMGVTQWQLVFRVLLPESFSGLLNAMTIILVGTVEGRAVAGAVGAGGVGDFAIEFGYQRFYGELMFI